MLWEPIGQEQRTIMNALKQNAADLDWEGALSVLHGIPQPPGPEWAPVYRMVLQCCCKAARYDEAHKVWAQLPRRDIMSYNTMMNLCGRMRKTEEAHQLLEQMKAEGIEPTGITHVTMIKAWAQAGHWEEAIQAFEELKRCGTEFSEELAYLHVLKACEQAGQAQKAREVFEEMVAGRALPQARPQVMHYNVLLLAHREDPERAKSIFEEMQAAGVKPRPRDWRALMVCFRHSFDETERIYQDMKRALGPVADEDLFEAILHSARACRDAEGARRVLEEMRSVGLDPDRAKLPALRRALSLIQPLIDGRDERRAAIDRQTRAEPAAPGGAAEPGPLPEGWGSAQDPNTGLHYFWRVDDPANTTTWERPRT